MTRYQVDSEAVSLTTVRVRTTMDHIRSEVTSLQSQLVELQSSWTGQAASAFQAVAADWHATQQKVEDSLSAIASALDQASRNYSEAEEVNARMFTG